MKKIIFSIIAGLLFVAACVFNSCNVTRVVTNESQYYQKGDTAVQITTRTVETYDATKKTR